MMYFRKVLVISVAVMALCLLNFNQVYALEVEVVDMYNFGYSELWEIQPAWSPVEQKTIAYAAREGYWGKWEIALIDAMDFFVKGKLAKNKFYEAIDPSWSPDGKKVIFSAKKTKDSPWRIMVVDLKKKRNAISLFPYEDTEEVVTSAQGDYSPNYSPDGEKVIFINCDAENNKKICVMSKDGTKRKVLIDKPALMRNTPRWSPDGKKILFMEDWDLWVMNKDGSELTQLTTDGKFNEHPAWSPDGKMIAYSSCAGGTADIWVMDSNGKNKTQLTFIEELDDYPTWSPDGEKIAFQRGNINGRIWVMELKCNSTKDEE